MKTINRHIDIFANVNAARKALKKSTVPAHLLRSVYNDYFVDRSREALKEWPNLYVLIDEVTEKELKG